MRVYDLCQVTDYINKDADNKIYFSDKSQIIIELI